MGSGSLRMDVDRNPVSRSIISSTTLTLQPPHQDSSTYTLKVELDNRSIEDMVDLDLSVELSSSLDEWE